MILPCYSSTRTREESESLFISLGNEGNDVKVNNQNNRFRSHKYDRTIKILTTHSEGHNYQVIAIESRVE